MKTPFLYRRPNEGAALVVVLALLVLVTVAVLIELAVSATQRTTSDNVASGVSAEFVARSGGSLVISQLAQEIRDGSPLNNMTTTPMTNNINAQSYVTTITNNSGYVTYQPPYTNSFAMRIAVSGVSTSLLAANTNLPLVKESARNTPFYSQVNFWQVGANTTAATNYYAKNGVTWASAASTTTSSASGHSISLIRWNRPLFLPLKTPGSTTDFTPTTNYTAPDWVYLTRGGPQVLTAANLAASATSASNPISSNTNYVIGRFAFNVYDEGGLLDVAAAGYNSAADLSATDKARKGCIGLADLTQITNGASALTSAQADALVAWRNASSYSGSGVNGYTYYLFNRAPVTGFMQPATGDESFVSRQDLIQFWLAKISLSVDALRYFTTFSRTVNAPAWFPLVNSSDSQETANNLGDTEAVSPKNYYGYRSGADEAVSFNRNLLGVRVSTSFTRVDGTAAVVGEPLIKSRFDLNRLGWITYNGASTAGVTAADIYNYFGLTWNGGGTDSNPSTQTSTGAWVYCHTALTQPAAVTQTQDIMTLDQVAAATNAAGTATGRDPDFFELLKAGILRGSLGLYSGNPNFSGDVYKGGELYRMGTMTNSLTGPQSYSKNPGSATVRVDAQSSLVSQMEKYQTIQIGANLIDQYTSDNYPTDIQLNGLDFYGIKNLPYLNSMSARVFRPPDGSTITPNTYQGYIHAWIIFSLWNPHMNAGTATTPGNLRVIARYGQLLPWWVATASASVAYPTQSANVSVQGRDFANSPAWITFPLTNYPGGFVNPTELTSGTPGVTFVTSDPSYSPIPNTLANPPYPDFNDAGLYVGWTQSSDAAVPDNATNPAPGMGLTMTQATNLWTLDQPNTNGIPSYNPQSAFSLLPVATAAAEPTYQTVNKPFNLELQYQDPNSTTNSTVWHTYQLIPGIILPGPQHGEPYLEPGDPAWSQLPLSTHLESLYTNNEPGVNPFFGIDQVPQGAGGTILSYLDPRTTRIPPQVSGGPSQAGWPNTNSAALAGQFYPGFKTGNGWNWYYWNYDSANVSHFRQSAWSLWDDNYPVTWAGALANMDPVTVTYSPNSTKAGYYTDRDLVRRLGDTMGYAVAKNGTYPATAIPAVTGNDPMLTPPANAAPYRPIVLSRPFHSVGEMDYTFRDLPWKSLDFFSNKSGDAALLDLFCLGPGSSTTPTAATPSVIAGTVNINSAPLPVLEALLSGAGQTFATANVPSYSANILPADVQTIATNYIAYIQGKSITPASSASPPGPLFTPADLPLALPQVPLDTVVGTAPIPTATTAFPGVKTTREAPIRALAGSVSTRTWNVLIDVIAQSGRFNPTATTLDQFSDKGERRYWIHVAIDRYTGKIIDEKVEFVPQ